MPVAYVIEEDTPISINTPLHIPLNMSVSASERRKQRWTDGILEVLSKGPKEGLTIPQIVDKLNDPSEACVRTILNNLMAAGLVSHSDGKPWKWYLKDHPNKGRRSQ